jgi:hypothetical protein
MGLLSTVLGAGVGQAAEGLAAALDRFVETDEEKRAAAAVMEKIKQEPNRWQAEINRVEAGHRSLFVAGWRPFIGWVCGLGLAWKFLLAPLMIYLAALSGAPPANMPEIQTGELIPLVLALLGLGGIRAWEKDRGLTR